MSKIYNPSMSLDFDDLFQEGILGLMIAIDKFNSNKNIRFSSYAAIWIKSSILRSLQNKNWTIRIPVNWHMLMENFKKVTYENPNYTNEDIAKKLNISKETLEQLLIYFEPLTSLDASLQKEDIFSTSIYNMVTDSNSLSVHEDMINENYLPILINEAFDNFLNEREIKILSLRYNLNTDNKLYSSKKMSFAEVAKSLGLSYETVRQAEMKAFEKLSKSNLRLYTQDYLN